jgi:hypothetical protein
MSLSVNNFLEVSSAFYTRDRSANKMQSFNEVIKPFADQEKSQPQLLLDQCPCQNGGQCTGDEENGCWCPQGMNS